MRLPECMKPSLECAVHGVFQKQQGLVHEYLLNLSLPDIVSDQTFE